VRNLLESIFIPPSLISLADDAQNLPCRVRPYVAMRTL
jgi:hypothetical protein